MLQDDDEAPAGAPEWIVTFADLMSLLLTFFVLLLSFSSTQAAKFEAVAGSLKEALGMRSELDLSDQPERRELIESLERQRAEQDPSTSPRLDQELQKLLAELGGRGRGVAALTGEGIVLNISGDLMFASGEATLSPEAIQVLDRIANYVVQSDWPLDVVGHTDNIPISTPQFPSNWELSAARAGSAVRYLVDRGLDAERVRAIGRASTRPVASNATAEGRSLNRRVEFIFNLRQEPAEDSSVGSAISESRHEQ
jgi:chemotaxis protein MotB